MIVQVKSLAAEIEVKTKGIELEIRTPDGKQQLGDLIVTKTQLIWCPGRTRRENGKKITWEAFREFMESR
jgi:hypothetical protein